MAKRGSRPKRLAFDVDGFLSSSEAEFRRLGFIDYNGGLRANRSLLSVVLHD